MSFADILVLALVTILWFGFCTLLTVLFHETGHLIFGILSGYRLTGFAVSGIMFSKGKVIKYPSRQLAFGQCFMRTDDMDKDPKLLIAGGCIVNLVLGIGLAVIAVITLRLDRTEGVWRLMLISVPALINIVMGMINLFGGSPMSDGNTLREMKQKNGKQMYNRVMAVTEQLLDGKAYSEMPEDLFKWGGDKNKCSLTAELSMYGYYREFECLKDLESFKKLMMKNGFDKNPENEPIFAEEEGLERKIWSYVCGGGSQYSEITEADARVPREALVQYMRSDKSDKDFSNAISKLGSPMRGLARSAELSREALNRVVNDKRGRGKGK